MNHDVGGYFEHRAADWDALYGDGAEKLFNRLFRKDVYDRARIACDELAPHNGRLFLDVGCGSGICSVNLARRGARVVGVDLSEAMLEIARSKSHEVGVAASCTYVCGDFLDLRLGDRFDGALALGVFDYAREPNRLLRAMTRVTDGTLVASFPAPDFPRAPLRKLRYAAQGCPVFFYTRSRILDLFADAGIQDPRLHELRSGFVAVADTTAQVPRAGDEK